MNNRYFSLLCLVISKSSQFNLWAEVLNLIFFFTVYTFCILLKNISLTQDHTIVPSFVSKRKDFFFAFYNKTFNIIELGFNYYIGIY